MNMHFMHYITHTQKIVFIQNTHIPLNWYYCILFITLRIASLFKMFDLLTKKETSLNYHHINLTVQMHLHWA